MRRLTALGLDTGLGIAGYAVAVADPSIDDISDVLEVGIIETVKSHHRTVRKTSDDLRRAKEHVAAIKGIFARHTIDVVAVEMSTTTPYTYPTFSFGVWTGILACLDQPIIEVLPREVKIAATGSDRATKRDVVEWAMRQPASGSLEWPTTSRSNKLRLLYHGRYVGKAAEHPADALATIQAAFRTEQYRLARRFIA